MPELSELLRRLEQGLREVTASEPWRRYLEAQARFHDYSPGNVLLILSQRPDATRVAGFRTWLALGRHVKKGERGIAILAPVTAQAREASPRPEPSDPPDGDASAPAGTTGRAVLRFRVVHVFDVAQTDGQPLPEPPVNRLRGSSGAGRRIAARLGRFAEAERLSLVRLPRERMPAGANGCYEPRSRRILLAADLSTDHQAKTLAHELAHHLLTHGRGELPRHLEEAAAEATAYVLCARYGLDTSGYSFGYVAAWTGGKDPAAVVKQVSAAVQRAAARLIQAVEEPAPPRRREPEPVVLER